MSQENKIEAKKLSPTTDFLPSDGASCSASSLLEWLGDNACELISESYAIADTGDYDGAWVVYDKERDANKKGRNREPIGWGDSPEAAIRDAMKGEDDPTKYNYVPPQYRQNIKSAATGCEMNANE